MLCCAVGIAAVAAGAIGWRRFRRFLCGRLTAQSTLAAAAVATIIVAAGGFAAAHFLDHAAHAADKATLPAGPLPLCSGSAAENGSNKD